MLESALTSEELYETRLRLPDALITEWDAAELIPAARQAIERTEDGFSAAVGHEILAFCLEEEDADSEAVLDHFRRAEEAYFAAEERPAAILAGNAQVERLVGMDQRHDAADAFVRMLEYWEGIPVEDRLPSHVRKALDQSFRAVKRKPVRFQGWREADAPPEDETKVVRDLLIRYRFHAGMSGFSAEAGTPEEVERFGAAVLDWSDDGLTRAQAYEMLAANQEGRSRVYESVQLLRKAEDEYDRWGWPFGAVEKAGEQAEMLLRHGRRSDAIDAFIRQLDHWLSFEADTYPPFDQGARTFFWRAQRDLEEAYKAVTNRKRKKRTLLSERHLRVV